MLDSHKRFGLIHTFGLTCCERSAKLNEADKRGQEGTAYPSLKASTSVTVYIYD